MTTDRCTWCLLPWTMVKQVSASSCERCAEDPPERCGHECDCDSVAIHDAAAEESMRDFLQDPGPPPQGFTPEQVERAEAGMAKARRG